MLKSGTILTMLPVQDPMHKRKRIEWLILGSGSVVLLAGLLVLAYQIPSIQSRLDWRIETARVFLVSLVRPIQEVPTVIGRQTGTTEIQVGVSLLTTPVESLSAASPESTQRQPTPAVTYASAAPTLPDLPAQVKLASPLFEPQDWNNCGPVSLSMYLNFYGWDGDQYDISDIIKPLRADRNVNIEELAGYVYQNVWWLKAIYRVNGDIDLLRRLIQSGFPVLVEETMYMEEEFWYNDDRWAGHYLLLTGYDDEKMVFISQDSFVGPDHEISYQDLKTNWLAFNRVYMVLYPVEQEQAVAALLGSNWDADQNRRAALNKAQQETQTQAASPFTWFNLGSNLVYFERYAEAAQAFDQARSLNMPQRMLRYQFSPFLAYFHAGRTDDLLTLADYALTVTSNSEEALLWKGWALYRSNQKADAIKAFQQALEYNPNYSDAQYAIQFVMEQ